MKVGLLTSGGDCQSLNATMSGMVRALYQYDKDVQIIGFLDGYKGLMYKNYRRMKVSDFENIVHLGGTILGSSRCPFKKMRVIEDGFDKVKAMKKTYKDLKLDALVVLGGNGSIKSANLLKQEGLNVIALPKTIDNDTYGTDYTFGFLSAVDIATNYLEQIKTTGKSHHRVFVIEIMGHKVGWIGLYAGIASNVDIVLLPEIPYDIDAIAKRIEENNAKGKTSTVIACCEGAKSKEEAKLTKKEYKQVVAAREGRSVVEFIAKELGTRIHNEIRTSSAGHAQRGGNPCSYDKMISQMFGAYGARLLVNKNYGNLVVLRNNEVTAIPLEESAGILKGVDPQGDTVKLAREMGISFGD